MTQPQLQSKLTAVLYADVAGYSRLTGVDEEGTHRALARALDLIAQRIEEDGGRTVHLAGDAVLAEFPSLTRSVTCAVRFQRELRARNAELPVDRRLEFRVGINMGEVIVDRGEIYGDDVNIAARLQGLAPPGGICVAEAVYRQVKHKVPLRFEHLGSHSVKNIAQPVAAYEVHLNGEQSVQPRRPALQPALPPLARRRTVALLASLTVGVLLGSGVLLWSVSPERATGPGITEGAIVDALRGEQPGKVTHPRRADYTGKPSIAVLPFRTIGGEETEQIYADGITNDLITELSRFRELLVMASHTIFTYKGRDVDVQTVGRELAVRYVLEGSLERQGEMLRIQAQLIEATSGHHAWAERYDRTSRDLLAIRDAIVETIVRKLAIEIDRRERRHALRKETDVLEAHDYVLRGRFYYDRLTRASNRRARAMFRKAIEADPLYAAAHVGLGSSYMRDFWYGWTEAPQRAVKRAADEARQAIAADPAYAPAHALLGDVDLYRGEYEAAARHYDEAIRLNPNHAGSLRGKGWVELIVGRLGAAVELLELSRLVDPSHAENEANLGVAYYLQARYADAITALEKARSIEPDRQMAYLLLPAAYARAGRLEDAERAASELRKRQPFFRVEDLNLFRDPSHEAKVAAGLRQAGLQ